MKKIYYVSFLDIIAKKDGLNVTLTGETLVGIYEITNNELKFVFEITIKTTDKVPEKISEYLKKKKIDESNLMFIPM